jgi:transposase
MRSEKPARYSTFDVRVRAVRAVRRGMSVASVAKSYQTHRATVHRWVARYQESRGLRGLARRPVSGRPRKLQDLDRQGLRRIVLRPASRFGYETDFWTSTRLLQVFRKKYGVKVCRQTIWHRLREVGLTYQKPERRYFQASKKVRQEWLTNELPRIRATVEKYRAILYCEDEANISLSPILGRTWAPKGKTPMQRVTGKRGGVAAMSAISKGGRLIFRLLEKRINSNDIINFLSQILKHHERRHVVVVMDRAACHVSKKTKTFIASQRRLHVFHFPSYSPDWNPDEKVWNHLKHHEMKGHQAITKKDMKKIALRKLAKMQRNPQQLRGIFFRCCVAELF